MMKLKLEYAITNLAELLEAAQEIHNRVNAVEPGNCSIHPSEIHIAGPAGEPLTLVLKSESLTDKSVVYNVEAK